MAATTGKINSDGAFFQDFFMGGWCCIIRDDKRNFLAAAAGQLQCLSSALHYEALPCPNGLKLASSLGMQHVLIETDSLNLQWLYYLVITTGLSWVCYLERSKVVWLSILDVLLQNVADPVI